MGNYGANGVIWSGSIDQRLMNASANWIWKANDMTGGPFRFQRIITNNGDDYAARIFIATDNFATIFLNNVEIGFHGVWETAGVFNVTMRSGENVLWVDAGNLGGQITATNPAAFVAVIRRVSDNSIIAVTNDTWGLS